MVHEIAREKATKKLGFWGRFLPLAVSSIAGAIVSFFLGGNLMNNIVVALVTALVWVLIWISVFVYYKIHEPAVIYNNQVSRLDALNEKLNPTAEIIITLSEDGEFEYKDNNMYHVARMKIFNNTGTEITKCYVTLQSADDVFTTEGEARKIPLIPSLGNFHKPDRIKWNETKYINEKCETTIPSKDVKYIDLADTLGTFHYNLCEGDVEANWLSGSVLHTFKIRIDYFNRTIAKFTTFEGYIYAAHHLDAKEIYVKNGKIKKDHEIIADQITYLKMIFKEGDWTQNEDIRKYIGITGKNQQALKLGD